MSVVIQCLLYRRTELSCALLARIFPAATVVGGGKASLRHKLFDDVVFIEREPYYFLADSLPSRLL